MPKEMWHDFQNGTYAYISGANIGAIIAQEQALLIDTGLDRHSARKAVKIIEAQEVPIVGILITHGHADHFGGAAWAAQRTGAPIYAPPLEGVFAQHPILEPLFLYGGAAPIEELNSKFTLARDATTTPPRPLEPGTVTIKGLEIDVINLAGHAPAQVGFITAGDGSGLRTCFCGDAVFPQETLDRHPILFCADLDAWLETLQKLPHLACDIYVAGHGDPIHKIDPLAHATAARLQEIREIALTALDRPKEPYEVLRAVAQHFDVTFPAPQLFLLSLTTINAALTSLQRHGQAAIEMTDNHLLWHAAT